MLIWFLSNLFSVKTLTKALSRKKEVAHISVMSAKDIEKYHSAIQAEILGLGVEMLSGIKTRPVFEQGSDANLH